MIEVSNRTKTTFSRFMSATRHEVLAERLKKAKAEAEEKGLDFDAEAVKKDLSPDNDEVRFLSLMKIAKAIEEAKLPELAFLNKPGYDRLGWIEAAMKEWDVKFLPLALKTTADAKHWRPLECLSFIKRTRNARAEVKESKKSAAELEAEKAARKERKKKAAAEQKKAHAVKEAKMALEREQRRAKKSAPAPKDGGKKKKKG